MNYVLNLLRLLRRPDVVYGTNWGMIGIAAAAVLISVVGLVVGTDSLLRQGLSERLVVSETTDLVRTSVRTVGRDSVSLVRSLPRLEPVLPAPVSDHDQSAGTSVDIDKPMVSVEAMHSSPSVEIADAIELPAGYDFDALQSGMVGCTGLEIEQVLRHGGRIDLLQVRSNIPVRIYTDGSIVVDGAIADLRESRAVMPADRKEIYTVRGGCRGRLTVVFKQDHVCGLYFVAASAAGSVLGHERIGVGHDPFIRPSD